MIWFYDQMTVSLHIGNIKTFNINNQTITHFVNIWSKEVPIYFSYPRQFNNIDGYLDARISPSFERYIIKRRKTNELQT